MINCVSEIATLDDLRDFVEWTICERKHLVIGAFQFDEMIIERHGKPCGLHFTLSGPRAVQFSAIWDAIRHTILFYDCTGERLHRADLPKPSQLHFDLASGRREAICG
jgi:hypothetical protein